MERAYRIRVVKYPNEPGERYYPEYADLRVERNIVSDSKGNRYEEGDIDWVPMERTWIGSSGRFMPMVKCVWCSTMKEATDLIDWWIGSNTDRTTRIVSYPEPNGTIDGKLAENVITMNETRTLSERVKDATDRLVTPEAVVAHKVSILKGLGYYFAYSRTGAAIGAHDKVIPITEENPTLDRISKLCDEVIKKLSDTERATAGLTFLESLNAVTYV